jgi:O-antigen/teichoic acid export membrane protein
MTISITHIAKNSLKFSVVQIVGAVLGMLASLYAATIILPAEYGVYGFLLLWLNYAVLIGPGMLSAGSREMPGLLGKGKTEAAVRIQNISLSIELIWLVVPFAFILCAAFFFSDFTVRIGMIIIAFVYLVSRLASYWNLFNFIREKFNTVAIGNLIIVITQPVMILIAVTWLKVYALLLAPLIVNAVLWFYYTRKGSLGFKFTFDRREALRLFKVSIILQAGLLVFSAYQLIDRTIIASMLTPEDLGIYTFAIAVITVIMSLPSSFTAVLQPILWRHAEKAKNVIEGFRDAKRIAMYLALGTAILVPLIQVGFYFVVNVITPKYLGSIDIFNILSYNIFLAAMVVIPNLILNSEIVSKQKRVLIFYTIGLIINTVVNIFIVNLGYGVVGVAWVTVASQGLMTLAIYWTTCQYMFIDQKEYLRLQAKMWFPFLITLGFFFFHQYLERSFGLRGVIGISVAAQLVVWGVFIPIFYRDYISGKEIKVLGTLIKESLRIGKKGK